MQIAAGAVAISPVKDKIGNLVEGGVHDRRIAGYQPPENDRSTVDEPAPCNRLKPKPNRGRRRGEMLERGRCQ